MHKINSVVAALSLLSLAHAQTETKTMEPITRVAHPDLSGTAAFVRVADGPLFFSSHVFARDVTLDARGQAVQALDALGVELGKVGGDLSRIIRLNAYVASESDTEAVEAAIAARFAAHPPALTLVATPLVVANARVAFDVVAAVSPAPAPAAVAWTESGGVLPAGAKVFLSGQVERGDNLVSSVRRTMEGLHQTNAGLGLAKTDVVQIKVFMQPFAEHPIAVREIAATFEGGRTPPIIVMQWTSNNPVEIEMVVSGAAIRPAPSVPLSFPPLAGKPDSPRYSHIAVVAAGTPLIFLGGLNTGPGVAHREQWKQIFERLGSTLYEAGSSFRHLVKATYYVTESPARGVLNEIRAVYYDPARPPAASAVGVKSVGRPDRAWHIDLIAIPHPGPR